MKPRRPSIKDSTRRFHSKKRSEQVAARAMRKAASKKAKLDAEIAASNGETQVKAENITQVVPFLGVTDMERSLRFYLDGLGFTLKNKWEPEGRIRWCWLSRGEASIMLQEYVKEGHGGFRPEGILGQGVNLCFQCEDALALYREFRSRGLEPSEPFVGNNMWVTSLRDPDGYRVEFESVTDVPEETTLSAYQELKKA